MGLVNAASRPAARVYSRISLMFALMLVDYSKPLAPIPVILEEESHHDERGGDQEQRPQDAGDQPL